jgi:hypothetical protein
LCGLSAAGLIETVPDAVSLHGLKKTRQEKGLPTSLRKYFEDVRTCHLSLSLSMCVSSLSLSECLLPRHLCAQTYGGKNDPRFKAAQQNFVESLASYSIATYILQVKVRRLHIFTARLLFSVSLTIAPQDRHNGNILVDTQGRLIHIDFGFLLGASPGGMNFETAPFKLTQEMLDVYLFCFSSSSSCNPTEFLIQACADSSIRMDGMNSQWWNYYVSLCVRGFQVLSLSFLFPFECARLSAGSSSPAGRARESQEVDAADRHGAAGFRLPLPMFQSAPEPRPGNRI